MAYLVFISTTMPDVIKGAEPVRIRRGSDKTPT